MPASHGCVNKPDLLNRTKVNRAPQENGGNQKHPVVAGQGSGVLMRFFNQGTTILTR